MQRMNTLKYYHLEEQEVRVHLHLIVILYAILLLVHPLNIYLASRHLLAQHIINHIFDDNGNKLTLAKLLQGPSKEIWAKSLSNDIGRLIQDNDFWCKNSRIACILSIVTKFPKAEK